MKLINSNIEIRLTWRLFFYIGYILTVVYLVTKALVKAYHPILAGIIWLALILSYVLSLILIKEEVE